jgi:general L-amino acid transport system substrate-binding protein
VPIETNAEARENYLAGRCDVYTTDGSGLASTRATFDDPNAHVILPEIISKEPLGPVVREGDDNWADIVSWTLKAMQAGEELGITSANAKELGSKLNENPEINRLLGMDPLQGAEAAGLSKDWALNIFAQVGNYEESFERNLTPLGLSRGMNALARDGGLFYVPPIK